jgi:tetratricopeptide (TPR) repeat protein
MPVKAEAQKPGRLPDRNAARSVSAGGLARHFEGWQPALLTVFLVAMTVALVVPRPVDPSDLPEPWTDPGALALARAADDLRASVAESEPLDADVRAVGSAVLEFGRADAEEDTRALQEARARVVAAASRARGQGDEKLLRLRAYQTRLFLREIRSWEVTGEESAELRGLGGGFLRTLRQNGWLEERAPRAKVLLDDTVLRVWFKKRWSEVTGLLTEAFRPALDEERAFYRFLLKHPAAGIPAGRFHDRSGLSSQAVASFEGQYRLKKIDELARIDPTYPRELARGIVLYRLGRYPLAVEAFRRHLDAQPDGPFALRAQNYLRAALGRARAEQF